MFCTDWLNTLLAIIERLIIINNQTHEHKLERQYQIILSQKTVVQKDKQYNNKLYYRSQSMKINSAWR